MKKLSLFVLGLLLAVACTDNKPEQPAPVNAGIKNAWILNEGGFLAGNAELGIYNLDSNTYSGNVFGSVNNQALGDVLQSAVQIDDEVFLVVNNSGKIEVVDSETFESTATISGLTSPRHMLRVSASEAYVSDLFSDSIAVINVSNHTIDHYIDISSSSEEMVLTNGKVYVTNTYTSHITVVDVATEAVSTITTTFNPTAIGLDTDGKVWVLCGGDFGTVNGALEVIDPASDQVEKTIDLGAASYTNKLAFNGNRDSLYFMTGSVYKIGINATSAPTTPFIDGSNYSLYGLNHREAGNEVWVGDAKDFSQKGDVRIYTGNGNLKSSFTAGVNPNGFLFVE